LYKGWLKLMNNNQKKEGLDLVIKNNNKKSYISYRYTRFVSLIKLVFLATATALTLLVITWSFSGPTGEKITISLNDSKPVTGITEGLTNGRFIGTDNKNQTYIITADYAEPIDGNPRRIALETLQADLTLDNGTWITLKAPDGILNRNQNELSLGDSVYIYADNQFEVFTNIVKVDLSNSIIKSDSKIKMQSSYGSLIAKSFNYNKNRQNIYFSKVRLILNSKQLP